MPRKLKPYLTTREMEQLETLGGLGMTTKEIALVLGKKQDVFEKRLERDPELGALWKIGQAKASAKVRQSAFKMATSEDCPALTIFWLKTRAGFRETTRLELTAPGIKTTDVEDMKKPERQALIQELLRFNQPFGDEIAPPKIAIEKDEAAEKKRAEELAAKKDKPKAKDHTKQKLVHDAIEP